MDVLELRGLLDDEDDGLAHLRREQCGLDVLLVLVPVADDQGFIVLMDRHDREELGLGARLEAVVERAAVLDDLFDDRAVLVHLDRINAAVLTLVVVLLDRAVERCAQELDPRLQDIAEAQQDRQLDAARDELVDELFHVDRARTFAGAPWRDDQVTRVVDAEVTAAPSRDVVGIVRVRRRPAAKRIVSEEELGACHRLQT